MEYYIKGTFKKTIFASNDGFTVGLIKIKETNNDDLFDYVNKQFTFTGLFHELNIDEDYLLYGNVVDNPKYGFQFKVDKYEKVMPEDKDGLVVFLSSDIFPGIGEKTAKKIVDKLGEHCLEMIIENYACLLMIQEKLIKYNESYEMVVFLTNLGFNMKDSLKIYNHYLDGTKKVIEDNIYELIDTVSIPFTKIDALKNKINIKDDDERRMLALIIHVIKEICFQTGDTYLEFETIQNG